MAQLNIIISVDSLFSMIIPVMEKRSVSFYMELINSKNEWTVIKIDRENSIQIAEMINDKYQNFRYMTFFLSSLDLDLSKKVSFYSDKVFPYAIEGKGGRETETEVETVELRVIAKQPDKTIKAFYNDLKKHFKNHPEVGIGILPYATSIHKNTFYLKSFVGNKTMRHSLQSSFYNPIEVKQ
jgi:hypothetical protein